METRGKKAFISYHSKDEAAVSKLAEELEKKGIPVWFDKWDLRPGDDWIKGIQGAMADCPVGAIFIGPSGLGRWEDQETGLLIKKSIEQGKRVIPVLLPGVSNNIDMPGFLELKHSVSFEKGIDDPRAFDSLVFGITGRSEIRQRRRRVVAGQPAPTTGADPMERAVRELVSKLNVGDLSYFIGRSVFRGESDAPPTPEEYAGTVSRQLAALPTTPRLVETLRGWGVLPR